MAWQIDGTRVGEQDFVIYWFHNHEGPGEYRSIVHVDEQGMFNWRVMKAMPWNEDHFQHVSSGTSSRLGSAQAAADYIVWKQQNPRITDG